MYTILQKSTIFLLFTLLLIGGCESKSTDDLSTPTAMDQTQEPPASSSDALSLEFHNGDYFTYVWTTFSSSFAQGSGSRTDNDHGRFTLTLTDAITRNGQDVYRLEIRGEQPPQVPLRWRYLSIAENGSLLGSEDGDDFTTIYDATRSSWLGGGFFIHFDDDTMVQSRSTLFEGSYNTFNALEISFSDSAGGCEYILGETLCEDSSSDVSIQEYVKKGLGPVAYKSTSYHSYSGGGFFSSYTDKVTIELIDTNITMSDGTVLTAPRWEELPTMPTPRSHFAISAIDHDIYIFGGYDTNNTPLSTVEVYNTESKAWRNAPDIPTRLPVRNTTYLHDDTVSFYTFDATHTDTLYSYTPTEGWSSELQSETFDRPLNVTTWNIALLALPSMTTTSTQIPVMYRLDSGGWYQFNTTIPNYDKHGAFEIVQSENILYRIGGDYLSDSTWNTWSAYKYAARFDLLNGAVMEPTAEMHYPRKYGHMVTAYDGKIYVLGGEDNSGAELSKVEVYDPETNIWEDGDTMFSPKSFGGSVIIDDKLYAIDSDSFEVYQLP